MKIYDITGRISDGIWSYGFPFPDYHMRPLPQPEWVETRVWCEIFDGMNSQTGTYLETPSHLLGPEKSYLLEDVPVEKLIDVPVVHLALAPRMHVPGKRAKITKQMLEDALGDQKIDRSTALLISCGWGEKWFDADYLDGSPYITRAAMEWIAAKKPFILGADLPRWENLEKPEGIFPIFYDADILMLAPLVIPEELDCRGTTLTVLPIRVTGTCCAPCRAILKGEYNDNETGHPVQP